MYVDADDYRPSSALRMRVLGVASAIMGTFTASFGAGIFALVAFSSLGAVSLEALAASDIADAPPEEMEPEVIEAAFIQLGRPFDPRELPDRQTATSTFARRRPDPNAVSMQTRAEVDAGVQPLNPHVSETLAQLGNRSELFNPSNFVPETEGEIEGSEEGRNSEGSIYAGQIQALLRRGFSMPQSIPETEYAGLRASVSVVIGENLRFTTLRIASSSGNAEFDRAVERRLAEVRESNVLLPEPPAEERDRFIGRPLGVSFVPPGRGRQRPARQTGGSSLDNLGAGY
jgi:outer membrane biosynthesis protein TonB